MKKLIAICAVALSMGAFADSYLYWMLNESANITWTTGTAPEYNTVKIGYSNTDGSSTGYLNIYAWGGTEHGNSLKLDSPADGTTGLYANIASYTDGYSYYIELLNDTAVVGRSTESFAYSATAAQIVTDITQTALPTSETWAPTSFAVPEPTSGMLLLFGLAGLALRRKQQKA